MIQTSTGQSGSPIFLRSLMDDMLISHLIGVHTGGKEGKSNYGTFIKCLSILGLQQIFTSSDNDQK